MGVSVLAAEGANPLVEAMKTAFTSVAGDCTSAISTVLPIGLGIVGTVMVVTFGIKVFKKLTGKA